MKVVEAAETESRHSGLRITDGAALTENFSLRTSDVVLDAALKHVASPDVFYLPSLNLAASSDPPVASPSL